MKDITEATYCPITGDKPVDQSETTIVGLLSVIINGLECGE